MPGRKTFMRTGRRWTSSLPKKGSGFSPVTGLSRRRRKTGWSGASRPSRRSDIPGSALRATSSPTARETPRSAFSPEPTGRWAGKAGRPISSLPPRGGGRHHARSFPAVVLRRKRLPSGVSPDRLGTLPRRKDRPESQAGSVVLGGRHAGRPDRRSGTHP